MNKDNNYEQIVNDYKHFKEFKNLETNNGSRYNKVTCKD